MASERIEELRETIKPDPELWKAGIRMHEGQLRLDVWYPRSEDSPIRSVVVGLMDVRAADDIRITYDFERDGWVISQASRFAWDINDKVCDPDWQEVAFVQAWARKETEEEEEARLMA